MQWQSLKQKAQAIYVLEAIHAKGLTLWEAFTAFDGSDNNGILSPSEFYGALRWLGVPDLTAEDVADFIEAADTDGDGFIDYKEYMQLLSSQEAVQEDPDEEESSKDQSTVNTRDLAEEIEPYGADELREVMAARRTQEQERRKEEKLRSQAYKDALDIKIFEEELEASRARKGGANPSLSDLSIPFKASGPATYSLTQATVTDFKFTSNQKPIRFQVTSRCNFHPINIGTAGDRPVPPMKCKKNHGLQEYSYYWMNCELCRKQGTNWSCWNCYYHVCSACYDTDKRNKEEEKRDPSKHPTFLRCANLCSFILQIPARGGANQTTGQFTISLELRVLKLPPTGHLQSLLRLPLPDLTQTSQMHKTTLYLNGDGRVVSAPLATGGEVDAKSAKMKPGYWAVVTAVVDPTKGTIITYINGKLCHEGVGLDPTEIRLQHKIVVLGGGKQALTRGGDIRRIMIHSVALDATSVRELADIMMTDNPGVGGRVTKFQAIFRGYYYRKLRRREDDLLAGKKFCSVCDKEQTERNSDELNAERPDDAKLENWTCTCKTHVGSNSFPLATMVFACPTMNKCGQRLCKTCAELKPYM